MSFKVAIASGKGGTGKTTIAVNLHYFIWKLVTKNVLLVDCDVEEPNDALFFNDALLKFEKEVTQLIPEINTERCAFCRKCVDYCEFNAITVIPQVKFAEVNADLCHSCGACSIACNYNAIVEKPVPIGKINYFDTGIGNGLTEGNLKIGSPMQTQMIKKLKKGISQENDIIIYDAPPGTSCPIVETVTDANYVILVAEPTPFGLYDLKLAVGLLKQVQKPFGVIINKAGLGDNEVLKFLEKEAIELLGEIPFNKMYASKYATGDLLGNIPENIESGYKAVVQKLLKKRMQQNEGNYYFKR